MIEKWNPVLRSRDLRESRNLQDLRDLWDHQDLQNLGEPCDLWDPQEPTTPSTSGSYGLLGPLGPLDPRISWDLRTLGPQDSWEITSTILNLESKHPENLKLKHKQRTFLNYIDGQSQTKGEKCVYLLRLFYLSSC